jgi:hypothetical protein
MDDNEAYWKIIRAMTPAQKLKTAEQLYWSARELKAAGLRMQHPDWTEEEIERAVREAFLYARS